MNSFKVRKSAKMLKNTLLIIVVAIIATTSADEDYLANFAKENKWFAATTYKLAAKQKHHENFLVCPLSAEIILSLAQTGAKGKTRQEIRKALHLPNDTAEINEIFQNLLTKLKENEAFTLKAANKIYIKEKYAIKESFLKVASEIYQSPAENINFKQKEKATKTINDWIAQQTENKITDLISSDNLKDDTVAILVNALYLQASWRKQFKKTLTLKKEFFKTEDDTIEVETMLKTDYHGYFESDELDAKFLQMQFKSGRTASMVIVLPNKIKGLKNLEKNLNKIYNPEFSYEHVDVALPKFKIESSIDFKQILKKLGVKQAFRKADFSGMAGKKGQIFISDILQKSFIEVNEDGVEASAATAVFYHPKSLMEFSGERKSFIVNHPFMFYITIDNIVVFTGRILTPEN